MYVMNKKSQEHCTVNEIVFCRFDYLMSTFEIIIKTDITYYYNKTEYNEMTPFPYCVNCSISSDV